MTKMTIANQYTDMIQFLADHDAPVEMIEFAQGRADQHAKRMAKAGKPTARQIAEIEARAHIADEVAGVMEDGVLYTVSELIAAAGLEVSTQKLTPILKGSALFVCVAEKGRNKWTLA